MENQEVLDSLNSPLSLQEQRLYNWMKLNNSVEASESNNQKESKMMEEIIQDNLMVNLHQLSITINQSLKISNLQLFSLEISHTIQLPSHWENISNQLELLLIQELLLRKKPEE